MRWAVGCSQYPFLPPAPEAQTRAHFRDRFDLCHQQHPGGSGYRDNGIGIPPEVKEKMFNPFFTTKPAGEGTGLGLSITHDIIVKQHSGSIEVDTQPGEFTEIRIILPRTATFIAESGGRA